jgi:WXG100 family type VII secretion target
MYTPGDIQHAVRKICNEEEQLRNQENRFRGEVETLTSWWQGNACKSFVQGYIETEVEINRLYSGMNNLEEALRILASKVQRADDERRRIEAEKRRVEAERKRIETEKNVKIR